MDNETPQTPNDGTPVVELRDVNKHFDDLHVLRDVNLSVHKGEVVVTHEMAFARKAADRVIFLADGQILADTDPQTFFSHPDTEQAREFLGELEG